MYLHIIVDGERNGLAIEIERSIPPPPGEILELVDGPGRWRVEKVVDREDGGYDMYLVEAPLDAIVDMYDLRDGHAGDVPFVPAANRSHLPRGWYQLTRKLVEDLIRLGWDRRLLQVKEKMGTLRFYIRPRTEALGERIDAATDESATVCEGCGEPGMLRQENYWWSTRCDACRYVDAIHAPSSDS